MADIKPIFKRINGEWVKQKAFQFTGGSWNKISDNVEPIPSDTPYASLLVEKITSNTYVAGNTYYNEKFIIIDIVPISETSVVDITYGGLTKTIVFTGTNVQTVFFGTYGGVTDDIETPDKGILTISGDFSAFGNHMVKIDKSNSRLVDNIIEILEIRNVTKFLGTFVASYIRVVSLEKVNLSNNQKQLTLTRGCFEGCSRLHSIKIDQNVDLTEDIIFGNCTTLVEVINNSDLNIVKGSTDYGSIAANALKVKEGGESEVVYKDGFVFYSVDGINYLIDYYGEKEWLSNEIKPKPVLPNNYNGQTYTIKGYSFYYRTIDTITFSSGVNDIIPTAFIYCDLSNINYNGSFGKYYADSNCLIETETNKLVLGSTNSIIPHNVSSIGGRAFLGRKITSVNIPTNIKSIEEYAFSECTKLATITFEENSKLTSIGNWAFYNCKTLTNVVLPEGLTTICEQAFLKSYNITSVTLPTTIARIEAEAFYNKLSDPGFLTSVIIKATTPPQLIKRIVEGSSYSYGQFDYNTNLVITIPRGSLSAYQNEPTWIESGYAEKVVEASE